MELSELGWDEWFQEKLDEEARPECRPARVTAVDRASYLVRDEEGEVQAEPTGRLLYAAESSEDLPCVGDWIVAQYHNAGTLAIIHGVLPRKSVLRRKAAGKKVEYQMIAANLDVAFIMQSCDFNFNLRRLERYLAIVNEGRIEPFLLLSKSDLITPQDLERRMAEIEQAGLGERAVVFSNQTGQGLDRIRQVLEKRKTYCLMGSSGVGKSTLLNHLLGREAFETNVVRQKDGKGRHTTTRRQLIVLQDGSMFIDNPGMRELGVIGVEGGIGESFADVLSFSERCRFSDCTHTSEPGCAVLAAIESGELSEERYQSYRKLMGESEFHEMSFVERRQKDREFGRYVKSVMKQRAKED
jgi:ribosome biogenesis GTPase